MEKREAEDRALGNAMREKHLAIVGLEDGSRARGAKACGQPLEAGKGE